MLAREAWLDLARKLDWELSYVRPEEVFRLVLSGEPWLTADDWRDWDEPYRTSYTDYVDVQAQKQAAFACLGDPDRLSRLDRRWQSSLKLHAVTFTLAEFAATIGDLRAARFGRDSAWRTIATFGALDELRHTQLPLSTLHDAVRRDPRFDCTHRFHHSNNWFAIAARQLVDEVLWSNPIEFAIGTNFELGTGFAERANEDWQGNPALQPLRELMAPDAPETERVRSRGSA